MQSGKTKNCDSYLALTALPLLNRTRVVRTHAYRQAVVTLSTSHLSSASSYVANRTFLRALPRLIFTPMMADPRIRPGCSSPLFFSLPLPLYHQSIRYTRMCKAARPKKSNTSRQTPNTPTFPLPSLLFPVINRPEVSDTQPFPCGHSLPTVSPGMRTYPHFYFISFIYSFRAFPFRIFLPDV